MKIYFAGSIRGGEPDREWFQQLITYIKQYSQVMTEHSFDFSYDEEKGDVLNAIKFIFLLGYTVKIAFVI